MSKKKFEPKYKITNKILTDIKQIGEVIGILKSTNINSNNLVKLQIEARALSTYASVSIEGNPLPLTDVKNLLKNAPNQIRDTQKEVLNYNRALQYINEKVKNGDFKLTHQLIQKIQKMAVLDLLDKEDLGKYRQKPVIVRDPKSLTDIAFLPPNYEDVKNLMNELIEFIDKNQQQIDPIILAGLFHKQHVIIHPFMDGNGRATRLITTALLCNNGIDLFEIFSFENYYNKNVTKYFQNVGVFGDYYEIKNNIDFTNWLEYFVEGILDELKRVEKILQTTSKQEEFRLANHHKQILNFIEKYGSINQSEYGEVSNRSLAARKLDFKKLIELGLIKANSKGKAAYYTKKII